MQKSIVLAFFAVVVACDFAQAQAQKFFVSVVKKDTVSKFISRYEAEKFQLVVTTSRLPQALKSVTVSIAAGDELHIIELPSVGYARLPREIFRAENFAGLVLPQRLASKILESFPHVGASLVSGPEVDHSTFAPVPVVVPKIFSRAVVEIKPEVIQNILNEFSGHVETTVGGKKVKITERRSAANRDLARGFLIERYQALGFHAEKVPYASGANVLALKPGKNPGKFIIVSSHMDNVGNAGANDDGSGTSSVLAIAHAIAKIPLDFSVKFMAFDEEELGLVGSAAYVKNPAHLEGLIANFHIDMIGRPVSNAKAFVADCDNQTSKPFADLLIATMTSLKIPVEMKRGCLGRSDHTNFWSNNKPALLLVEDGGYDRDPCYHKACDIAPSQDYTYMAQLATGLANTILSLKLDRTSR